MTTPKKDQRGDVAAATAAGAGAGAVAANEYAGAKTAASRKSTGQAASRSMARSHFKRVAGISDAPRGTKITQKTHPQGTYHISMDTLAGYQNKPVHRTVQREEAVRQAIQREGFRHPAQLRVYHDGADLWDGNHRALAARSLGMKSIPVHVEHVDGKMPRKGTLYGTYERARTARYRRGLAAAAHLAKGDTAMTTSAFGVVHAGEIEKGVLGAAREALPHLRSAGSALMDGGEGVGSHLENAMNAFKGGLKPPTPAAPRPMPFRRPKPGPAPQVGTLQRARNYAMAKPGRTAAGVGAAGLGAGYMAGRN